MKLRLTFLALALTILVTTACAPSPNPVVTQIATPSPTDFRIMAGSDVKTLEDAGIFKDFTTQTGVNLNIRYKGSVDIKNLVAAYTAKNQGDIDAFWAASSIWLPGTLVQNKTSVMRTYVTLGIDPETLSQLGWNRSEVKTEDVIAAIRAGKLSLAMPSASQDDAGATFLLATLASTKGNGQVLQKADLSDPAVIESIKTLFGAVNRSAASADALKDIIVQDRLGAKRYNATVLPESMLISANQEIAAKNGQPLQVVYITDAISLETFPVGYVDKSSQQKIDQFNTLIKFLKTPAIQDKLKKLGWRTGVVGMAVDNPDTSVFNPAWGINSAAEFAPITLPKEAVIDQALNLYQGSFRKPSFTLYCLDFSGSMGGNGGEEQLKRAMDLLLDQTQASAVLLQATPKDENYVFKFDNRTVPIGTSVGNDPVQLKNLSTAVQQTQIGGGTAMFDCVQQVLDSIANNYHPDQFNYSIIVMTDGQSRDGMGSDEFDRYYKSRNLPVPVYGIGFSDSADYGQLNEFKQTGGDVCDGHNGGEALLLCFRKAKGNN